MWQLAVTKQGSVLMHSWQDRVATFDPNEGVVYLSAHDNPSELCRHKLAVREVRLWPTYTAHYLRDLSDSPKNLLTVKVVGWEVPVTPRDKERVRVGMWGGGATSATATSCADVRTDRTVDNAGQVYSPSSTSGDHAPTPSSTSIAALPVVMYPAGVEVQWVLRCPSIGGMKELVAAFAELQRLTGGGLKIYGDVEVVRRALNMALMKQGR